MSFRKHVLVMLGCLALSAPLAGCDNPEQKEAKHIKRGNALMEEANYKKARIEYKNAAQLKPTDAEPYYRLGLVDEHEGDLRNAFGNYTSAERQNPRYYPAVLKLAQYFMAAEQYDEARKRIEAALADEPNNAEAHAMQAALLLRQGKLDEAEKEGLDALEKDPASVSGTSALAGVYSAKKETEKAIATVNKGIEKNPKNLALLLLRVLLYQKQEDYPKVVESYKAIFMLKPEETQFRADLATILAKANKMDEAEQSLREGVKELPDNWGLKRQLVVFLAKNRGVDVAETEIKKLIEANPTKDELYFWLADVYSASNASDKAVELLNQVVERGQFNPSALDARTLLARLSIKRGNQELAQKLVATVLEKKPDNRAALLVRANLSFDNGDYQSAISDLRDVLRVTPSDKEALQLLGETYFMQGHADLAIDTLKKLAEVDPTNFAARVRLAQIVGFNGDTKQAMNLIGSVTKAAPTYAIGWEAAARIAIDAKQWLPAQEAIKQLEQIEGQKLTAGFLEGQIFERTGKDDEAIEKYKAVVDANPSTPLAGHALVALVDSYARTKKLDVAAQYLETLKIETPAVATLLARCYMGSGKTQQAAAAFDKAIDAKASFAEPYLGRANLYVSEGVQEKAIEVLKKAFVAVPGDFRPPLVAADLLTRAGKYKDARELYEKILDRNPTLDLAANNLAELIADYQSDDPASMEKARTVAERFNGSNNPLLLDTLAWVYFKQGNIARAQTIMERAFGQARGKEDKLPPQMHYHYGAILLKAGNAEKAKAEFAKATPQGAEYPGVEEARKLTK